MRPRWKRVEPANVPCFGAYGTDDSASVRGASARASSGAAAQWRSRGQSPHAGAETEQRAAPTSMSAWAHDEGSSGAPGPGSSARASGSSSWRDGGVSPCATRLRTR